MRHEKSFSNFLKNTVNLNKTRYDVANSAIQTMTNFLKGNDLFNDLYLDAIPQGSFRQETIIKPARPEIDFDVDLLFRVKKVDGWEPKDYIEKLSSEFKNTDRYKDLVDTRGKERCVTIDYESDFHIDIVPAIIVGDDHYIMNKSTNQYEPTDGDGYAEWFASKNEITGGKHLTKVTRLLKYVRDIRGKFEIKSILLTTLIGNQVNTWDSHNSDYPDLSTSFVTLVNRLDIFLQNNQRIPTVQNPVLPKENFNRKWTQEKYQKFREAIHEIALLASDAYQDSNEASSLQKWQKVFGDKFVSEEGQTNVPFASSSISITRDPGEQFLSDFGIHENLQYTVKIDAKVTQNGFRPFNLRTNLFPLRKQHGLDFFITTCNVPEPYAVKWKIKNTGQEAASIRALRGEIINDDGYKSRHESTKYEGTHYVECYVIKNNVCVAKDHIDVPIGKF